jgi:ribosome production factor 2
MVGAHSKKRPHTLVMGRMFDYRVLDMVEVQLEEAKAIKEFKVFMRSMIY